MSKTNTATMTPYAASKIANKALEDAGVEKVLPPQMFYTYAKKAYIKPTLVDGKVRIKAEDLQTWLTGYINKLQNKATETTEAEVDKDQLALDLETSEA
jgi:LPS O-antigen subunit length determinant protein (WzzB/FepE family)